MELELIVLGILLLLSGFFSGSETALISINKFHLRKLSEEGHKNAQIIEKLVKQPNKMLAAILIGNNLVNVAIAAIITQLAIQNFRSTAVGIATGIATILILIFGEVIPKSFATKNSEELSLLAARPVQFTVFVLSPIVKIFTILTDTIFRLIGQKATHYPFVSEDELRMLMDLGAEEGVIEEEEKEMIQSVFEFGDTTVKEVMTPRTDIRRIDVNTSFNDILDFVIRTGHSRIPVYENSIDNIIGILYAKDLFESISDEGKFNTRKSLRPAYFVPGTKKLTDLFKEMRARKMHFAIVLDEYGGTAGIVTLEDILEEIVGEISDEYDVEERPVQIIDEKTIVVDARMSIDEVGDLLDVDLEKDGQDSIGGLVFSLFDHVPKEKDSIRNNDIMFTVEEMIGKRILKIKVTKELPSESV